MPIKFRTREITRNINVHLLRNTAQDIGLKEITAKSQRSGCLDSGYHYIVRQDGTLEEGRDLQAVSGFFTDSVDILTICKGDEPDESQTLQIIFLVTFLKSFYPEATLHNDHST